MSDVNREKLLMETLRWLFSNDPHAYRNTRAVVCLSQDGKFVYSGGADKDIPRHLLPIIHEAAKP